MQAAEAGGTVGALLGNHEAQLMAAHLFATAPVPGWDEPDGFRGGWARFGGRDTDLDRLGDAHDTVPAVNAAGHRTGQPGHQSLGRILLARLV